MRLIYTYYEQKTKFDELQALLGPKGLGLIHHLEVVDVEVPLYTMEKESKAEGRKFHLVSFGRDHNWAVADTLGILSIFHWELGGYCISL